MITQWYFVSKTMSTVIPHTFPYLKFQGLVDEMRKDPNFKKEGEEDK